MSIAAAWVRRASWLVMIGAVAMVASACTSKSKNSIEGTGGAAGSGGGSGAAGSGGAAGGSGAAGSGGAPATGKWPDSASVFCTDGAVEVTPCPDVGSPAYGQDGNYLIGVPTYDEGKDTVTDSVTGLVWEVDSPQNDVNWDGAVARCASLKTESRTWRLPSRLELATLLDFGRKVAFPGLYAGTHWSSSEGAISGEVWTVNFLDFTVNTSDKLDTGRALCVSGAPLSGALSQVGSVLQDSLTGLEWQTVRKPIPVPWLEALAYCEADESEGHVDWRLPSAKELITLIRDDQASVPGLDGDANDGYWTSSPDWPPDNAKVVQFPDGYFGADDTTVTNRYARCVRTGD